MGGGASTEGTTGRSSVTTAVAVAVTVLVLVAGIAIGASASKPQTLAGSAAQPNGHTVDIHLTAMEDDQTIVPAASGVSPVEYHVWTFDGTAPGPVIRVHLGDTINFTLTNASSIGMQHSIDFHAAMTPWANLPAPGQTTLAGNYQPVDPGKTKTFTWTAMYPGAFMYHCGVPPVLEHIANGMYGAIIVEPDNLPKEREYVLVQSEFYPGKTPVNGVYEGDYNAMLAARPSYVVWNGVADQYKAAPLEVKPGEPFRVWVVNAGPTLTSAFHVIGTMFDTYVDGNPANLLQGLQTYNIPPGGGAMFEMNIPDPGLYPFVTHAFAYTALGSVGIIRVDPNAPAAPESYPEMGDPFSAGVDPFKAPASASTPSASAASSPMASMPSMAPMSPASEPQAAGASCSPSGAVIHLAAKNSAFDQTCIAAPAGQPFSIAFSNDDPGVPHNVSIFTDDSASKSLYVGKIVTGPTNITYKVGALSAGSYYFRCDVHPTTMYGTLVVK